MDIKGRIKEVLRTEAAAIAAVVVDNSYVAAVAAMENCTGKIVTTGMGKAGHVARKFAAVLCSTGTPSAFIHSGDALHGDLGLVAPDDCVLAFSNSGKTREVLQFVKLARKLGAKTIIGVTSHADAALRAESDFVIDMGTILEPCPLGLTPTASVAVMSAISDALALVLMEKKGISREEFALRHHDGYLGQSARMNTSAESSESPSTQKRIGLI